MDSSTSPGRQVPPVYVEESILSLPVIYINAGRKGLLVEITPDDSHSSSKPVPVSVPR